MNIIYEYEYPVHEHPVQYMNIQYMNIHMYTPPLYYKINGKKILPKLREWQGNIHRSFFIVKTSDEHSKYKMIIIITLRIWIWNFQ